MTVSKRNNGFTLIEIVLLIVIIGIMGSIAVRSFQPTIEKARETATIEEMDNLSKAIIGDKGLVEGGIRSDYGYIGDIGALPSNLDALVTNPGGYSTWYGPYIRSDFSENTNDYKEDAWGIAYTYTGSIIITSNGGSSAITRQFAQNDSDLIYNTVRGVIVDNQSEPPADSASNVAITIFYPDGSGGSTSLSINPNSAGSFSFTDAIPIGNHLIRAVYSSTNDTTAMYVSVTPIAGAYCELRFTCSFQSGGSGADSSHFYMSTTQTAVLGGVTFYNDDIIDYYTINDSAAIVLTGNDVFTGNENINAVYYMENGHVVLSTESDAAIGGLSFQRSDLVRYDPLGDIATIIFDGSAIFSGNENIDAVHILSNGHIILSTSSSASIGGLSFDDEDLIEYDPVAGTATMYLVGRPGVFANNANIDAVFIRDDGLIVMSTDNSETVNGTSVQRDDVFRYDPGNGVATVIFQGDSCFANTNENVDALHMGLVEVDSLQGGLVSHWLLDESSGTIAYDSSMFRNNGTLTNMNPAADWVAGKIGGGLDFDGSDDKVIIPDADILDDTPQLTISVWVHPSVVDGNPRGAVSKRISWDNNCSYGVFLYTNDKLNVDIASNDNRFASPYTFTANQWYHLIVVYDGTLASNQRVKVYINNILDITATESNSSIPNYASDLVIGQLNGNSSGYLMGIIDDVRIYNRALGDSEIQQLYNLGN